MPRILNVQIPDEKRVLIGLTYIKGIGLSRSKLICKALNISNDEYMQQLTKSQLASIVAYVRKHYKIGQKISPIESHKDRGGVFVVTAKNLKLANRRVEEVYSKIKFVIRS